MRPGSSFPASRETTFLRRPLELHLQTELNLTREISLGRQSEQGTVRPVEVRDGHLEIRAVEQIEGFRPELEADTLRSLDVLEKGEIHFQFRAEAFNLL